MYSPQGTTIRVVTLSAIVTFLTGILPGTPMSNAPTAAQDVEPGFLAPDPPPEVDCAQVTELGFDKQMNMYADLVRIQCGLEPAGQPGPGPNAPSPAIPGHSSNVPLITGGEIFPKVTQSESMVWSSDGNTIVTAFNDSADSSLSPRNYSGAAVSYNGGFSFQRLRPNPFQGGGFNAGDPIVVYNAKYSQWFAGFLISACGGQGIGIWSSTDATNWSRWACVHVGDGDDRESIWVNNNASSPNYGCMYVSWNNFAVGGGALQVTTSCTGGVNGSWSAPTSLSAGFLRNVQMTGSPGVDGTVFIAAMDEGGGGFSPRQNIIFRSLDNGGTWTSVYAGPMFSPPGDGLCNNPYFARINPIWRHMGWGQPAVGPALTVHYAYAGAGIDPGDAGDIFYIRSIDNGTTWSAPSTLNTDAGSGSLATQWMPSVSATASGKVQVGWYDRRHTTEGQNYEYFGITSTDGGATFGPDFPISDIVVAQPAQPDPAVQSCYAGDYNYHTAFGDTNYVTWTDGRVPISGVGQQDVYFDQVR